MYFILFLRQKSAIIKKRSTSDKANATWWIKLYTGLKSRNPYKFREDRGGLRSLVVKNNRPASGRPGFDSRQRLRFFLWIFPISFSLFLTYLLLSASRLVIFYILQTYNNSRSPILTVVLKICDSFDQQNIAHGPVTNWKHQNYVILAPAQKNAPFDRDLPWPMTNVWPGDRLCKSRMKHFSSKWSLQTACHLARSNGTFQSGLDRNTKSYHFWAKSLTVGNTNSVTEWLKFVFGHPPTTHLFTFTMIITLTHHAPLTRFHGADFLSCHNNSRTKFMSGQSSRFAAICEVTSLEGVHCSYSRMTSKTRFFQSIE